MGVYAPNVEAPKSCCSCGFSRTANYREEKTETGLTARGGRMCSITGNVMPMYCSWRTKMNGCPLVEISGTHGRLIDADVMKESIVCSNDDCRDVLRDWVDSQPTVVDKERSK